MLNLLIILAFAGVIVISAGFAGVTFMQGVQSSLDAQITTQRLLDVATEIQSHMRFLDPQANGNYILALPSGTLGSLPYQYNQVPTFITSNARGANGVPFEYCPYAQYNDSKGDYYGTITMASGATYNMGTYNWSSESSSTYYGGNDTSSQNYLTDNHGYSPPTTLPPISGNKPYGLLIAAAPNQFYPPDCSSVSTDISGAYAKVSGGIAIAITNDFINKMRVAGSMTDFHFYVSTSPSGDGSGRDTSNYITLPDALTIIQTVKPASAMIYVDATGNPTYNLTTNIGTCETTSSGSCATSPSNDAIGGTFSYGKRIYLEGINGSGAIVNTSSNITIDEHSLLSIGNLTFQMNGGSGFITVHGTLEMADSSPTLQAANTYIYGGAIKGFKTSMTISGNVFVDGGGVITSAGPMIFKNLGNRGFQVVNGHVYGGTTMEFDPVSSGIVPIIIKAGGDLISGTDTMTINNTSNTMVGGMIIDPGGRFFGAANSPYRLNAAGNAYGSSVVVKNAITYGFYVHGEMDLAPQSAANAATPGYAINYTGTAPSYGIILASGGKFQLEATSGVHIGSAGNPPGVGILDNGGAQFFTMASTGSNHIHGSTACWQSTNGNANLFANSSAGNVSGNATATLTSTFPAGWLRMYNNSANLVCN